MLPPQQQGVCYIHAAINVILNTPPLLEAVLACLDAKLARNKYTTDRDERGTSPLLTQSNFEPISEDAPIKNDALRGVHHLLRNMKRMDPELYEWAACVVMKTRLRRAAARSIAEYKKDGNEHLVYKTEAGATNDATLPLFMLPYDKIKCVVHNKVELGDTLIQKDPVYAYSKILVGGDHRQALFDILANVGAKRVSSGGKMSAVFPNGTRVFLGENESTASTAGFERDDSKYSRTDGTGLLTLGSNGKGEHAAMYRRDGDRVQVIDSNRARVFTAKEYDRFLAEEGMQAMKASRLVVHVPRGVRGGAAEPVVPPMGEDGLLAAATLAQIDEQGVIHDEFEEDLAVAKAVMQAFAEPYADALAPSCPTQEGGGRSAFGMFALAAVTIAMAFIPR